MAHAGRGTSGLKGRPKLQKDIAALGDKAKREKRLEENVANNQRRIKRGKKARTIAEQSVAQIQQRAANLRVKANAVARKGLRSQAYTYRRAARELLRRIPAMRKGK